MENTHLIYFSPALSTRKVMRIIGKGIGMPVKEYDVTQGIGEPLSFDMNDLVVFGVPVFAGRVPPLAVEALQKFKGNNTPAVIVCVYGNRDYDDALLELKDICEANSFNVIAAGAFVARHSIFPKVGQGRPDEQDKQKIIGFGERCIRQFRERKGIENKTLKLNIKGNYPYRKPSKIPFTPKADSKCDKCGICAAQCPVDAISEKDPRKTDKKACISCARCIAVCPQNARSFKGILYKLVRRKFEKSYVNRKEMELFFGE